MLSNATYNLMETASVISKGLSRAGISSILIGGAGLVLFLRAATNLELKRLFGVAPGRWAVTVQKTIDVAVPLGEVWDLWSRYENFPQFMSHVREVRRHGAGRASWTVAGPGGVPFEWETVETRRVPKQCISWRTMEGALVAHAGVVRFEPCPGGTRIHVRMHYNPPVGAIGHGLATLLGADPKRVMDEDLLRLKSLLEEGKTTAHGETVRRGAIS